MASGLVPGLKARYPHAKISWLVEPVAAGLLADNPLLDEVIPLPRPKWKQLWKARRYGTLYGEVRAFVQTLKARHFDLVVDTQGLLKSGIWAWLSGARRRVGLGSKEGSQHFMTEQVARVPADPRISSEYKDMLEYLGGDASQYAMYLPFREAHRVNVEQLLQQHRISGPFVVCCPFTTRPQKHWFDHHWQVLTEKIQHELNMPCVMLGGPGDKAHAETLALLSDGRMLDLAGHTSLLEAVALIDKASLLIGVDTGLTHIGTAQNTPTVALFGSTVPYLDPGVDSSRVIYHRLACSPCQRRPTCDGRFDCLLEITPDEVMRVAHEVMP